MRSDNSSGLRQDEAVGLACSAQGKEEAMAAGHRIQLVLSASWG